jgi:hypothetical protein
MDRRTGFFLGAATLCGLLVPVAGSHAWVAALTGIVYVLLAGASWLEEWSRRGR